MSFSRTSLGQLDLNLLATLVVLVEERSTIHAAKRLHLAQSTVSGLLGKLREVFEDEILVRSGRCLEPTSKALDLVRLVRPHLEALSAAVGSTLDFDPARHQRVFHLGCTDAVAFSILPPLMRNLRERAPECDMIVRVGDYRTLPDALASGEVTTAIGYLREGLPATAKVKVLRTSPWVVLRDPSQAPVESIDDFCRRPQAIVTPRGDLSGFVDDQLQALGRTRRVTIGLSSFALLLTILPGSDMISTVPDFIARELARIGQLAVDSCPVSIPPVPNSMAWSIVADRDPAEVWFRNEVAAAFAAASHEKCPADC